MDLLIVNRRKITVLVILLFMAFSLNAQTVKSGINQEVSAFYNRLVNHYGNLYVDTVYGKCDTQAISQALIRDGQGAKLSVLKDLQLHCISFRFQDIGVDPGRIVTPESFFRIKDGVAAIQKNDQIYAQKLDSFLQTIGDGNVLIDSEQVIQRKAGELLFESTIWEDISSATEKSRKKLLRIAGVYESEKYYLILYTISELDGVLHSKVKFELIIK